MTIIDTQNPILIDLPLPIETERLVIREPRFGDGKAVFDAKAETWDMLHQWMPWAKEPATLETDELNMRKAHVKFLERVDLMMLVFDKLTGQLLGGTGLHRFDWDTRIIEIGYWYRKSAQGKGYATEATKALTRYAFDVLKAQKVIIVHAEGNGASKRVIERCGFNFEYTVKGEDRLPSGQIVDKHHYGLFDANHLADFNVNWGGELHD